MPDPTPDPLAEVLREQGWEPDSNVCRCGHRGGDHDLNNWCLVCQPPRSDYFASYSQGELWDNAVARLRAAGVVYPEPEAPDPLDSGNLLTEDPPDDARAREREG
jgi:hypothetical protein